MLRQSLITHFLPPLLLPGLFLPMCFLLLAGIFSFPPRSPCVRGARRMDVEQEPPSAPPSPLLLLHLAVRLVFSTLARPWLALVHLLPSPFLFRLQGRRFTVSCEPREEEEEKKIYAGCDLRRQRLFFLPPSSFAFPSPSLPLTVLPCSMKIAHKSRFSPSFV